jgi:hypothetical protein
MATPLETPSAFFNLVSEAQGFGYDDVIVILANSRTGDYALRSNCDTNTAVIALEEVAADLLDAVVSDNPPVKSLRRKDVI